MTILKWASYRTKTAIVSLEGPIESRVRANELIRGCQGNGA